MSGPWCCNYMQSSFSLQNGSALFCSDNHRLISSLHVHLFFVFWVPSNSSFCLCASVYMDKQKRAALPHVYTRRESSLGTRYSSVLQWGQDRCGTFPINSLPWSCAGSQLGLVSSAHWLSVCPFDFLSVLNPSFFSVSSTRSDLICFPVPCCCFSQALLSLNPFCCSTT